MYIYCNVCINILNCNTYFYIKGNQDRERPLGSDSVYTLNYYMSQIRKLLSGNTPQC